MSGGHLIPGTDPLLLVNVQQGGCGESLPFILCHIYVTVSVHEAGHDHQQN
jgi:hypothetical protein